MKYIQFIFILLILLGCNEKKNRVDKIITDNTIKSGKLISIEKTLIDTMIFKKVSIIPLETNDESLFQEINRISISNGRIYIFDNKLDKICIFDEKGKYINQIHKVGQGPEEYIAIWDFCLDKKNNEIIVLCDRPYKIMRFSLDGTFIKQTAFSNLYNEISISSDYLFCQMDKLKERDEIGCFDREFHLFYKGLSLRNRVNNNCHSMGKSLVKSKKLCYTRQFDPYIYYLSKEGIEKKYKFDFGKYTLPEGLSYQEDCSKIYEICSEREYVYSITNAVESDKYVIFNTNLGICLYEKEKNKLSGYKLLQNQSLNRGSNVFYETVI